MFQRTSRKRRRPRPCSASYRPESLASTCEAIWPKYIVFAKTRFAGPDGGANVPARGSISTTRPLDRAIIRRGPSGPKRDPLGAKQGKKTAIARGPSRVHRGALTSTFGPTRLLGDDWVCDMALGRLSCARIGDGDVRAAVVGAAHGTSSNSPQVCMHFRRLIRRVVFGTARAAVNLGQKLHLRVRQNQNY